MPPLKKLPLVPDALSRALETRLPGMRNANSATRMGATMDEAALMDSEMPMLPRGGDDSQLPLDFEQQLLEAELPPEAGGGMGNLAALGAGAAGGGGLALAGLAGAGMEEAPPYMTPPSPLETGDEAVGLGPAPGPTDEELAAIEAAPEGRLQGVLGSKRLREMLPQREAAPASPELPGLQEGLPAGFGEQVPTGTDLTLTPDQQQLLLAMESLPPSMHPVEMIQALEQMLGRRLANEDYAVILARNEQG